MSLQLIIGAAGLFLLWIVAMRLRSRRARQVLYLISSYIFYASWASWLLVVLLFSSGVNYALGEWLKKRTSAARLWTGIAFNLVLLSFFKYLPLAGSRLFGVWHLHWVSGITLPLGISFWTFQALSYLFEVYREEELNPTLVEFCLYMGFWPTVLSGPICRLSSMLPQFRQSWRVGEEDLKIGMRRIAVGVLMSLLAMLMSAGLYAGQGVDALFARTAETFSGLDVWTLILGYGFQLYFNFCGYSHIVIGAARLFGIRLHENFDRPYVSTTPSVFWTRWHMSLSFWIRDFVFLPLATLRAELWWRNLSLVIAMFIFGIWHKGSILFMIWGVYHGLLLVLHRQWQEFRKRVGFEWSGPVASGISWFLTFSAVLVGYIFFRSESMTQSAGMLRALISPRGYFQTTLPRSFYIMTLACAFGYFAAIGGGVFLDQVGIAVRKRCASTPSLLAGLLLAAVHERWVWIAPLVVVAALYLSAILRPGQVQTGPVMYALF